MTGGKYVHTHLHSEYSLLDGINKIKDLPTYVKSLGQDSCSLTDHGNLGGTWKFFKSCREQDVKPIIGLEAYYTCNDRTVREADELGQRMYHLVLLAQNNTGLHNLYKLNSKAYDTMWYKPRLDDDLIGQYNEGLIATSACLGSRSSQLILDGQKDKAEKLLDHHASIFKDRFFIELQLHEDKQQQEVNKALIEVASRRNWPLIVTNDCHYMEPHHKEMQQLLLAMQMGTQVDAEHYLLDTFRGIQVHVGSHDWMWKQCQKQGIPYEAISNTVHLATMIDDKSYFTDRKNRFPHYKALPQGHTADTYLKEQTLEGLATRYPEGIPEDYIARANHELTVIKRMGFSDYMLIVAQLMEGARSVGVWCGPGRGSSAGSIVAYALNVTQIDPIKYNLLFSRFLNEGRSAQPLIVDSDMIDMIENLPVQKPKCSHRHQKLPGGLLQCLEHSMS